MRAISLSSGSNGNCFYLEAGEVKLIIEAGLTSKQYENRLNQIGVDPRQIDAILVSHEHSDHILGAGAIHRKYGTPIYMTHGTANALPAKIGYISDLRTYPAGVAFFVGNIKIQTVPSQHDCAEGVHFVISDSFCHAGFITDAGAPSNILHAMISPLDILFLESNYDSKLLNECKYPEQLKTRIRGGRGHLSNLQAAQMIRTYASERLKYLVLCHISENANTMPLVREVHSKIHKGDYHISLAPRDDVGEWVGEVRPHSEESKTFTWAIHHTSTSYFVAEESS